MTTLYGLNNCDTCKKARKWLDRFEIAHAFVDYRDNRQAPETLVEWKNQLGGWESLINKSSTTWRTLPPNRKEPASDAEWKLLLKEYPQLIRRPVVVTDDGKVTQGFSDNGFKQRIARSPPPNAAAHADLLLHAAPSTLITISRTTCSFTTSRHSSSRRSFLVLCNPSASRAGRHWANRASYHLTPRNPSHSLIGRAAPTDEPRSDGRGSIGHSRQTSRPEVWREARSLLLTVPSDAGSTARRVVFSNSPRATSRRMVRVNSASTYPTANPDPAPTRSSPCLRRTFPTDLVAWLTPRHVLSRAPPLSVARGAGTCDRLDFPRQLGLRTFCRFLFPTHIHKVWRCVFNPLDSATVLGWQLGFFRIRIICVVSWFHWLQACAAVHTLRSVDSSVSRLHSWTLSMRKHSVEGCTRPHTGGGGAGGCESRNLSIGFCFVES
ncbi:arsenate reductase [Lysobacter capsici]|nr:arsenate reductase [Lysobacter capsici]